jgi:hypothetical protein
VHFGKPIERRGDAGVLIESRRGGVLYRASRRRRRHRRVDAERGCGVLEAVAGNLRGGTRARRYSEFTLVAGDTPYDILAAHRCALPIAAVLSGGFERELLTKAEFIFDDVEEFVRKIDIVDEYFSD